MHYSIRRTVLVGALVALAASAVPALSSVEALGHDPPMPSISAESNYDLDHIGDADVTSEIETAGNIGMMAAVATIAGNPNLVIDPAATRLHGRDVDRINALGHGVDGIINQVGGNA